MTATRGGKNMRNNSETIVKQSATIKKVLLYLGIALVWVVMLVLTVRNSMSVISPGYCYSETIFVGYNETYNNTFEVCATNCSDIHMNLSLYPGQSKVFNDSNCFVSSYCSKENCSLTTCDVTKTIDPGDDYLLENAVCNLDITCDECDDCDTEEGIPVNYKESFKLEYDSDAQKFNFEFADYSFEEDANTSVSITKELEYRCPVKTANTTAQVTADQCEALIPLYCDDILAILIDQADVNFDQLNKCKEDLDAAQSQVHIMKSQKCMPYDIYNEQYLECVQAQNSSETCQFQEGFLNSQLESKENNMNFWTVLAMFFFSTTIIQFIMQPKKTIDSGLGGA